MSWTRRRIWAGVFVVSATGGGCQQDRAPQTAPAPAPVELAPAAITAAADRGFIKPDEPVIYSLHVEHNPDIDVQMPAITDSIGGMKVTQKNTLPLRSVEGRIKKTIQLTLQAPREGAYVLPKVGASYTRQAGTAATHIETQEVYIQVSNQSDPAPSQLQDIKPLQPLVARRKMAPILLGIALLLVATLLAWWFLHRARRAKKLRGSVGLPPHMQALGRLEALLKTPTDARSLRRGVFEASEVLRAYAQARFAFSASNMTTEEILAHLLERGDFDIYARETLKAFLRQTDEIKYAGYAPPWAAFVAMVQGAQAFVNATAMAAPPDSGGAP